MNPSLGLAPRIILGLVGIVAAGIVAWLVAGIVVVKLSELARAVGQ